MMPMRTVITLKIRPSLINRHAFACSYLHAADAFDFLMQNLPAQ